VVLFSLPIRAAPRGATKMSENLGAPSVSPSPSLLFALSIRQLGFQLAFPDAFPFLYVRIEQWGSN
jgi:hypothetical protein